MNRRFTHSSKDFRDDLDYNQLTLENALGRKRARQDRHREGGRHTRLSQRLAEHDTLLTAGVGRTHNPSPMVTPRALQVALASAGIETATSVASSSWCEPDLNAILEAVKPSSYRQPRWAEPPPRKVAHRPTRTPSGEAPWIGS